jgi:hypothetical protein
LAASIVTVGNQYTVGRAGHAGNLILVKDLIGSLTLALLNRIRVRSTTATFGGGFVDPGTRALLTSEVILTPERFVSIIFERFSAIVAFALETSEVHGRTGWAGLAGVVWPAQCAGVAVATVGGYNSVSRTWGTGLSSAVEGCSLVTHALSLIGIYVEPGWAWLALTTGRVEQAVGWAGLNGADCLLTLNVGGSVCGTAEVVSAGVTCTLSAAALTSSKLIQNSA